MPNFFYSASINGFYLVDIFWKYPDPPTDVVLITYEEWKAIQCRLASEDVVLTSDENGYPTVTPRIPFDDPYPNQDLIARQILEDTQDAVLEALETGLPIPEDIKIARENARNMVRASRSLNKSAIENDGVIN